MKPLRFAGTLLLAFACGHALLPSARANSALQALLASGVERSVARLTAPGACADEPATRIDVATALGPLARALHGTGRGPRLAALATALCRAGGRLTAALEPWLVAQAEAFEAAQPEALMTGAPGAATAAFRTAIEPGFRERFAAGLEVALLESGVPEALDAVREAAARLPLPREVALDPEAALQEHWPEVFFAVLGEEEARLREAADGAVARLAARRPQTAGWAPGEVR